MSAPVANEYIIRKPRLSEKATRSMESKQYCFDVDPRASKDQIKAAVQAIFKVRVIGVNTQVRKAKRRRTRFGVSAGAITKTAVVRVHADDSIELF